jgi:hypothetical protein
MRVPSRPGEIDTELTELIESHNNLQWNFSNRTAPEPGGTDLESGREFPSVLPWFRR